MRYILLSDVHGRSRQLASVLADARVRGVDRIISLGDVGGDDCLALLRHAGALAVFGNYEVSGWRRLAPENRAWVRGWPPLLVENGFLAVHAAPWWPEGLHNVKDFGNWLRATPPTRAGGTASWQSLFPYLMNEDQRWQALAELEMAGKAVLFHGHTHHQAIWCWEPANRLQRVRARAVNVDADQRYLVGVGSVGLPEDGGWAAYALYDTDARRIELVRLNRPIPGE